MKIPREIALRREYYGRWARRNRPQLNTRKRIAYKAYQSYPIQQKCEIVGCCNLGVRHHPNYNKPDEIMWLCTKHHFEQHRIERYGVKSCKYEGCTGKYLARGMCHKHYLRERKQAIKERRWTKYGKQNLPDYE